MRRGFSPLDGFMTEEDYTSVVDNMRLSNGLVFGLPVVLDTDSEDIRPGDNILLTYQVRVQQSQPPGLSKQLAPCAEAHLSRIVVYKGFCVSDAVLSTC